MVRILIDLLKNKKGKLILPFFIFGCIGIVIEVLFRGITGSMIGVFDLLYISQMGYSSIWMVLVYGTGGTILSLINEMPQFYKQKVIIQALTGGLCLILTELLFGVLLNIVLELNLWCYSFVSLFGQIGLINSILWIFFTPAFICLIDFVGWCLYREEWKYNVFHIYKELFTFK